jgi:hypothetical protein
MIIKNLKYMFIKTNPFKAYKKRTRIGKIQKPTATNDKI